MVPYVIYQFWTGENKMSPNRQRAFEQSKDNLGVPVKLLYKQDIEKAVLPQHPLHPVYPYLSHVHKSDYLRSYFMNFYGGGYADIKYFSKDNNWKESLDKINQNEQLDIIGTKQVISYPYHYDVRCNTIPKYTSRNYIDIFKFSASDVYKMLGNSYFIVRPHSRFSEQWYKRVNLHCDQIFDIVSKHPAILQDNNQDKTFYTEYPLRWQELQRQIFHPLCCQLYDTCCVDSSLVTGRQQRGYR